jgi:hypothetical protein
MQTHHLLLEQEICLINMKKVAHIDSLEIFELGYSAFYSKVMAQVRSLARIYHPDKHNHEHTGLSSTESKISTMTIQIIGHRMRSTAW